MRLRNKVAVVTGGTRGIGLSIAKGMLAEGAQVVLVSRSLVKGDEALTALGAGGNATFVAGDVMRRADVEAALDGAVERYGRLDVLVNNAGGCDQFSPVAEMTDEAWQRALDWNLTSVFWATRHALRYMIPRGQGRIINISSIEGKHGKPGVSAYAAAKHAVHGFTKSVAREVGTLGITVNAICPGLVLTDLITEQGEAAAKAMGLTFDELVETYVEESALKRPTSPEEVAAVAVLLASEPGGGITGATISIDSGTAHY
jgi:3-hydroxybutyrate dehydrogenase